MHHENFSRNNPVALAYLAMLSEAEKKDDQFKKKDPKDKEEESDETEESEEDTKAEKSEDSDSPPEEKDGEEEGSEESQEEGEKAGVPPEGNAKETVPEDGEDQETLNPDRPEWVPDTVADKDLSNFINATADALEDGKTQFTWGGRYFIIQRKTAAELDQDLDPNLEQDGIDGNPADSKNKQQNFGEGLHNIALAAKAILEASVHPKDDGYSVVARHAWDLSKKAHNGGTADDHHLAAHIHQHAVNIQSMRYGGGEQQAHHQEIAKHRKALGLNEAVEYPHSHVKQKIKDGDWEAQYDLKVDKHNEIIDHSDGKKKKTIYVVKDPIKESAEADVQTQKVLDMHKKILKVIERPDEQKQDGTDKVSKAPEPKVS